MKIEPTGVRLDWRLEAPEPVLFRGDIVVEGDTFRLEESSDHPAQVQFRCHAGTLALIMSGRLAVSNAVSQGKLALEGDSGLASRFSEWFKGI